MTSFNVSPPPVATRLLIPSINNNLKHHTSITTHSFSDRILVTVGQSSPLLPPKIGTLVLTTFSQSTNNNQKSFDSQILLGRRDDPLLEIYGRQLLEKFSTTDTKGRKELLLGINLREDNRDSETFQEVCNNVLEMLMSQIS